MPASPRHRRAVTATKHEPGLSPLYRVLSYGPALEVWDLMKARGDADVPIVCYTLVLGRKTNRMDVSARTTMKGGAKCDKHCELQDSVNQQKVERILLFRVILESMFASVSFVFSAGRVIQVSRFRVFMFQCSIRCIDTCVLVVLDRRNVEHLLQEGCYL